MENQLSATPGFISARGYSADDGEELPVVEFDSEDTLPAWRYHPEHKTAQQAGRGRFLESYRDQVCRMIRDSSIERAASGPR